MVYAFKRHTPHPHTVLFFIIRVIVHNNFRLVRTDPRTHRHRLFVPEIHSAVHFGAGEVDIFPRPAFLGEFDVVKMDVGAIYRVRHACTLLSLLYHRDSVQESIS